MSTFPEREAYLKSRREKRGQRPPRAAEAPVMVDSVEAAVGKVTIDSLSYITFVARSIPYQDLVAEFLARGEKPLSYEMHRLLLGVAIADLFTDNSDELKAKHLSSEARDITVTPAQVQAARQHPFWKEMGERVRKAASYLAGCKTIEEFAEKVEEQMTREHLRVAVFARGNRDRMRAAEEFTGRRSAKKGRSKPQERSMWIPEDLVGRVGAILKEHGYLVPTDEEQN